MTAPAVLDAPVGTPLLVGRELRVRFSVEGRHLRAVDGVDLEVRPGETVALVGESGCGKSTLARTLMRVYEPESGSILFDGEDVTHGPERRVRPTLRRMQMVQQDPFSSLDPRMTVRQILYEPLRAAGWRDPDRLRQRSEGLLEEVGLSPSALDQRPSAFSGGQRQRIAIARALAPEPELLIADEPLSALDLSVQAQLINLFADLRERHGVAYLFISHDLMVVNRIADRVVVMYLGRVVEEGPARSVFAEPQHPYTAALLSAVPGAESPYGGPRIVLSGDPPSPLSRPQGCPFHTRCPQARRRCSEETPELTVTANSRRSACFYPMDARHGQTGVAPLLGSTPVSAPSGLNGSARSAGPSPAPATGPAAPATTTTTPATGPAAPATTAVPVTEGAGPELEMPGASATQVGRVIAKMLGGRMGQLVATVFSVMTALFFLLQLTGNPAAVIAGQNASPQQLAAIEAQYGFNRPVIDQYLHFIGMIFSLNFGNSYSNLHPALGLVQQRVLPTVGLTLAAMALNVVISLVVGSLIGAFPDNPLSRAVSWVLFVCQGIPFYVIGLVLIEILTVQFHLLPSLGDSGFRAWILPSVTLAWFLAPRLIRVTAVNMTAVMGQQYVQVARAVGARKRMVIARHALPNALIGTVAFAGTQVAYLISGTLIVEEIFGWPGLGRLLIDSITRLDFPVVEAAVVFIAIYVYAVNALVDVLIALIDPRLRRR